MAIQIVPNAVAVKVTLDPAPEGQDTANTLFETYALTYNTGTEEYGIAGDPTAKKILRNSIERQRVTRWIENDCLEVAEIISGEILLAVKTIGVDQTFPVKLKDYNPMLGEFIVLGAVRGKFVAHENGLLSQLEGVFKHWEDAEPIKESFVISYRCHSRPA